MRIFAFLAVALVYALPSSSWAGPAPSMPAPASVSTASTASPASPASGLSETTALLRPERDASIGGASGSAAEPAMSLPAGAGSAATSALSVPVMMPTADAVVVRKSERRLYLMRNGQILRSYRVALGLDPQGPKQHAGDFRTPEGLYYLTRRNPRSDYFLSIQVSYPSAEDVRRAQHEHLDPGGSIMLHGLPNTLRHKPDYYEKSDWTDGCIALSDSDMVEVWLMTRDNTPIEILP